MKFVVRFCAVVSKTTCKFSGALAGDILCSCKYSIWVSICSLASWSNESLRSRHEIVQSSYCLLTYCSPTTNIHVHCWHHYSIRTTPNDTSTKLLPLNVPPCNRNTNPHTVRHTRAKSWKQNVTKAVVKGRHVPVHGDAVLWGSAQVNAMSYAMSVCLRLYV
jgi:hypothetical protein